MRQEEERIEWNREEIEEVIERKRCRLRKKEEEKIKQGTIRDIKSLKF